MSWLQECHTNYLTNYSYFQLIIHSSQFPSCVTEPAGEVHSTIKSSYVTNYVSPFSIDSEIAIFLSLYFLFSVLFKNSHFHQQAF